MEGAPIGRALRRGALGGLLVATISVAYGEEARKGEVASDVEPLERIVALVDEDPIFASELERAALWLRESGAEQSDDSLQTPRELLDQLIDERLRAHEVDRYGAVPISDEEVRSHLENAPPGIDIESAESLVRRQLRVLAHVEERLGALVFVSDEAVRGYYESTLRDEMLRQGVALPPFEDVQKAIRALLREQALEERIVTWTEELRQRATIIDLLDEPMSSGALPPLRLTIRPGTNDLEPDESKPQAAEKEKPWPPIP